MVVIVLTACPVGLRGHLTKWLLEISPGVFVGHITKRVRNLLWDRVVELAKDGRAILIHSSRGEQQLSFRVHRHDWAPVDFDGVTLMLRPAREAPADTDSTADARGDTPDLRRGWSNASRYRSAARTRQRE